MIKGITHENGARNKKDEFSNMANGRHIGFVNSAIRAIMLNKHCGCYNLDYLVVLSILHLFLLIQSAEL